MFFIWAVDCHAKLGQREAAALKREDFVQEHDHAGLHGEPNTGKTKAVLGHGCESVASHVAAVVLGMAGQGAQGQRTVVMPELGCRVRTELSAVPGFLLLPFPSFISQQNCHLTVTALYLAQMASVPTPAQTCVEILPKVLSFAGDVLWSCLLLLV